MTIQTSRSGGSGTRNSVTLLAATTAATVSVAVSAAAIMVVKRLYHTYLARKKLRISSSPSSSCSTTTDYESLIGNTPLIHLRKLSAQVSNKLKKENENGDHSSVQDQDANLNINIYVKMESMNPGGTGKDRAALFMLRDAEERRFLPPPIITAVGARGDSDREDMKDHDLQQQQQPQQQQQQQAKDRTQMEIQMEVDGQNANSSPPNHEKSPSSGAGVGTGVSVGAGKDIKSTIQIAIQRSKTGGIVVEGTSGSTGISLATLAAQRGHGTIIVMPDDQAMEKMTILRCLGAVLHVVPTAAISNPNHYVNVARKIAEEINCTDWSRGSGSGSGSDSGTKTIQAAFMNQFENEANYNAHIKTTGPEIWRQTNGKIDAFCMSSGTGGTISGVGQYLKDQCCNDDHDDPDGDNDSNSDSDSENHHSCKIILVDPPGSALLNKVKYGIAYASEQRERALLRHRYDTIAEGIGLDRVTSNFALGTDNDVIDDAMRVTDQEAVDMAHWLLKEEGLFVGSSSAMNVCGAVRLALSSSSSSSSSSPLCCIVTVICDGGQRHLTRFWNRDFIRNWGLEWPEDDEEGWIERLPIDVNA